LLPDNPKPGARVIKQRRNTSLVQLHNVGRPAGTKVQKLAFLFAYLLETSSQYVPRETISPDNNFNFGAWHRPFVPLIQRRPPLWDSLLSIYLLVKL
jgi:hypothetical protein